MIRISRRPMLAISAVAALAVMVGACGSGTPSASLPPSTAASTVAPTASSIVSATATPAATSAPSPSPASTASTASVCVVTPSDGQLPSDRLVDLKVTSSATADRLTFIFGDPSLGGPGGPPQGSLQLADKPYVAGGSGEPIEVRGQRVLQVRFSAMSIANDVGQEVYIGPREVAPSTVALRHVVLYEAFEGIIGFYVGYDGPGCAELGRDGNSVTLTIQRP